MIKFRIIFITLLLFVFSSTLLAQTKASNLIQNGSKLLYSNTDSAFSYFKEAEKISIENNDSLNSLRSKTYIALYYQLTGNYEKSVKIYFNALELSKKYKIRLEEGTILNNLGALYFELKDMKSAEKYYDEALVIMNELQDTIWLSRVYGNIAGVYFMNGDYDKTIEYLNNSIECGKAANKIEAIGSTYSNLAMVYTKKGDLENAFKSYEKGLNLLDSIGITKSVCITLNAMAKLYLETKNYQKADSILQKSLSKAKEVKHLESIVSAYKALAETEKQQKNFAKAYQYMQNYSQWKDSVLDYNKTLIINELNTKYQTEKKEQEINNKNKELAGEKELRFIIISALLLLIIATLFILYHYFQKQKAYKTLVIKNIELINKEQELSKIKPTKLISKPIKEKYSNSILDEKQKQDLLNDIIIIIEEEKYYLNKKITINLLAKVLNTNSKYISQVINEKLDTSFSNFINKYRVSEVCKMLLNTSYSHLSFEGIAEKAGFSSKSAFNKTFKKFTGVTPSYFKENHNI